MSIIKEFKEFAIKGNVIDMAVGIVIGAAFTINFAIVAFAMFAVVKAINRLKRKQAESPKEPPKPTKDQELLTEIRDLLKAK